MKDTSGYLCLIETNFSKIIAVFMFSKLESTIGITRNINGVKWKGKDTKN